MEIAIALEMKSFSAIKVAEVLHCHIYSQVLFGTHCLVCTPRIVLIRGVPALHINWFPNKFEW